MMERLTIDEAIAHAREVARVNRLRVKHPAIHRNDEDEIEACILCAEEHEQLAEWLEDYKRIKMLIPIEQALKAEYNKAIDDFAEKLNTKCDGMIKDKWNSNVAPVSWAEAYADFKDDIDEIAEQLKEKK